MQQQQCTNRNRIMTRTEWVAFLVVLTFPWAPTSGDTDVSCIFMENCTLPCSSEGGTDVTIHWFQVSAGNLFVHSFYNGSDQFGVQNHRFRGRTALFSDQLSSGNASLQLTGVKVQDEGRYNCLTITKTGTKESFINLKMDAPIHEINIHRVGNDITCSSEGIYPQPELTWSTKPPSSVKGDTGLQETEQHLYNIRSSLICSGSETDLSFICTIRTRGNTRMATLPSTSLPKHRNSGAILGGVIVAIIVVAVAAAVGLMLLKRKRDSSKRQKNSRRDSREQSDAEIQPMANAGSSQPSEAI